MVGKSPGLRTSYRTAYIGPIPRELQITQYHPNTYACDGAILNLGVQYHICIVTIILQILGTMQQYENINVPY